MNILLNNFFSTRNPQYDPKTPNPKPQTLVKQYKIDFCRAPQKNAKETGPTCATVASGTPPADSGDMATRRCLLGLRGLGVRVQGLGVRVWGLGFRGLGFGV